MHLSEELLLHLHLQQWKRSNNWSGEAASGIRASKQFLSEMDTCHVRLIKSFGREEIELASRMSPFKIPMNIPIMLRRTREQRTHTHTSVEAGRPSYVRCSPLLAQYKESPCGQNASGTVTDWQQVFWVPYMVSGKGRDFKITIRKT